MKNLYSGSVSLILLVLIISAVGCRESSKDQKTEEQDITEKKGLKDYYSGYFPIGVAVYPEAVEDSATSNLIKQEFASMTPENVMKMGPIHPEPNRYNWEPADKIVDFAQQNGLLMRGHALVWHQQYPDWFFKDEKGNQIGKDTLFARMKKHITDVVSRYKGKIYAWDVVNEAVSDQSGIVYREESPFYQISGEEYLTKAFEYAHAADPEAKLFYNDYNAVRPEKAERIFTLVKKLTDAGVPIHGVGIQGHWSIFEPTETDLRKVIEKYASLGLEVQITELDVSLYEWEKERRPRRADEQDVFTSELEQKQLEQYGMFFDVFRDYKDIITGVTFWNISDKYSWLDTYPVAGRKNYPLLFDKNLEPKKAYYRVIDFKE